MMITSHSHRHAALCFMSFRGFSVNSDTEKTDGLLCLEMGVLTDLLLVAISVALSVRSSLLFSPTSACPSRLPWFFFSCSNEKLEYSNLYH